jgi:uncharacterized protein
MMKVLSLSDITVPFIYSPQVKALFSGVDFVVGCGDLPYYYPEYIISSLDVPLFYVRGNHAREIEYTSAGERREPLGAVDLHRQMVNHNDLLLAGIEGSLRYCPGPYQYTQNEMWFYIFELIPALLQNRLRYGRFLDIFVTHASPWGIHDQTDLPHHGIKAFRWFIKVFQPAYHFHGHIHVYRPDTVTVTEVGKTQVINTYGYRETTLKLSWNKFPKKVQEQN